MKTSFSIRKLPRISRQNTSNQFSILGKIKDQMSLQQVLGKLTGGLTVARTLRWEVYVNIYHTVYVYVYSFSMGSRRRHNQTCCSKQGPGFIIYDRPLDFQWLSAPR
jgi:hypothetical protein